MDRILMAAVLAVLSAGCQQEPERWTAFVYPPGKSLDAMDAQKAIYGTFSSFEECQSAAIGSLRDHHASMSEEQSDELGMGDYECGVACRWESNYDLYMCKETRK